MRKFLLSGLLFLASFVPAAAAVCGSVPYTFVNGTTADAGQVNANFTAVLNCFNNNVAPAFTSQPQNEVFASPAGMAGIPSFRTLTPADMAATYLNVTSPTVGAKGDGTTDNTTVLQTAINNLCASPIPFGTLYFPYGNYLISSALTVNCPIHMIGDGGINSVIYLNSTTQDGFDVTTVLPVVFENFGIAAIGTQTGGYAIKVDPGGSNINTESQFIGMRFASVYVAMDFERAAYWKVDRANVEGPLAQGFIVQDLAAADAGDSTIENSLVVYASSTNNSDQDAVYNTSGGGLRLVNNKFLNGFRGLYFNLLPGANTGTFVDVGNSFEDQFQQGIFIQPQTAGSGTITKWVITGNEFLATGNASPIVVFSSGSPAWFSDLTISGNVMSVNGLSAGSSTGHGIDITEMNNVVITGNMIHCSAAGGSTIGVLLSATVNAVGHAGNNIQGCTTGVSNSSTNPYTSF